MESVGVNATDRTSSSRAGGDSDELTGGGLPSGADSLTPRWPAVEHVPAGHHPSALDEQLTGLPDLVKGYLLRLVDLLDDLDAAQLVTARQAIGLLGGHQNLTEYAGVGPLLATLSTLMFRYGVERGEDGRPLGGEVAP